MRLASAAKSSGNFMRPPAEALVAFGADSAGRGFLNECRFPALSPPAARF